MTWDNQKIGSKKARFYPKRPVRNFRDLEVYQRTSQAGVNVMKKRMPECPANLIAEVHSRRFEDEKAGLKLLDESMAECNSTVVYIEQVRDLYSSEVDKLVCEESIKNYCRAGMLRGLDPQMRARLFF